MGLSVEDELYKLKNSKASELVVVQFVSDDGDDNYTVYWIGSNINASAVRNFDPPEAGNNVACIKSGNQLLIIGALSS